ncbi:unnamed protein product [Dibothriocephalus latus]|uniref:Uncharacterized protein n=1 Tax=Dibothriocephalus latus TaxID=60516 RepID=A0A3P7LCE1_DIBLA|nr:unnamed protein product [Dibothriocephalus latus]
MDQYSGDESVLFSARSEKIFQHIYHVEPRIFNEEMESPVEVFPTPDWCEQMCTLNLKLLVTVHRQYAINLLESGHAITQRLVGLEGKYLQACQTQLPLENGAQIATRELLQPLYSLENIQGPKFEVLDIDAVEIQLNIRKFPCVSLPQCREIQLLRTIFGSSNLPAAVTTCCLEDITTQIGSRCCNRTESIEEMEPGPLTYTVSPVAFHADDCTLYSLISYDRIAHLPDCIGVNSVQPSGDALYDAEAEEEEELVFHKCCSPTVSPQPYIRSPKESTSIYHISPLPLLTTQTAVETNVMNDKPDDWASLTPPMEEQEQVFVLQVTDRLELSLQQGCAVRSDFAIVRVGTLRDLIAPIAQQPFLRLRLLLLIMDDTLGFDGALRTESPSYETAADSVMETENAKKMADLGAVVKASLASEASDGTDISLPPHVCAIVALLHRNVFNFLCDPEARPAAPFEKRTATSLLYSGLWKGQRSSSCKLSLSTASTTRTFRGGVGGDSLDS